MAVRAFLRWPDPRLRQPAEPVGEITDDIRAIWADMVDTMEAMPGVGLAALIWLMTWAVQVPAHRRLESGFDPMACRRLVRSNWARTIAWTLRGGVALAMTSAMS